jgi:acyl-CoA dehydrogenase
MDFALSSEQEMIVTTVRDFVETEIYPHEDMVERTGEVPMELAQEIKRKVIEMGFYACNFPEEVGGGGLVASGFHAGGARTWPRVHGADAFLRAAAEHPDGLRGRAARAVPLPGGSGRADGRAGHDGTGGRIGCARHVLQCAARRRRLGCERDEAFHLGRRSRGFLHRLRGDRRRRDAKRTEEADHLFPRGSRHPGFTVREGYQSVSHRGYKNCILEFDDCRLPDAQVLGAVDGGFEVMNTWLYATRLTVAAFCVGRARRCFDHALAYAAERKQFGQPIAKFQGVSFQVADMITEIDAADWLTLAAAWRLDQDLPANREIASAKLYASEMLARVTDTTLQIHGGMGLMDDFPIERFWRDARVERIWDGTSEIQRHIISRDLFRPLGA